ncbi:MAG: 30S ribosomal protein S3 [Candidatus Nanohaloarchaea archaeon]
MQEKQFIQKGAQKVKLNEFLSDELEGAGYSSFELQRTPTSTKVVVYAQKPGLVIGRGGSRIRELTEAMEEEFDFENPQIEVNEIEDADGDAQVVADSIADWLEKGGHVKRVGYTYLRRMKEAGVIGAEVEITGKLSGNRGRTEKFSFGYVKRCGNTSKENVQKGYQLARTKPGAIGVKVRIMKQMPDFMHRDVDVDKEIVHETDTASEDEQVREKTERIEQILSEAENMTSAELERAIEEKAEEVETSDITSEQVREAFEEIDGELEDFQASEEDESKMDEEKAEADSEESEEDEGDESEYEDIVSGTISDAKDRIDDLDEPDYEALLEAEKDNKNRTTFIDWLEAKA